MTHFMKKHLFIIVILVAIVLGIFFTKDNEGKVRKENDDPVEELELLAEKEEINDSSPDKETDPELVVVDIKGEIMQAGVYEVASTDRVNDVVKLAGGFTDEADQTQINLAEKVVDEMIIIVAKEGEIAELPVSSSPNNAQTTGVRVNVATLEELSTLKGIGPSKAQAILTYREENGLFQTVEDLLLINGIGEKTLENMRDEIIIP